MSAENDEPVVASVEAGAEDTTTKQSSPTSDLGEKKPLAVEPLTVFSDESYACDRQYAIVLAQLMSVKERAKVYTWIERLLFLSLRKLVDLLIPPHPTTPPIQT